MGREVVKHGKVKKTYPILSTPGPKSNSINGLNPRPKFGPFIRASPKPTGKCHISPECKTKGSQHQHGLVRAYPFLSPSSPKPNKFNRLTSQPTSPFIRVYAKPMGKCYISPACKANGARRLHLLSDNVADYSTWKVVDVRLYGFSGTRILDYLDQENDSIADYQDQDCSLKDI